MSNAIPDTVIIFTTQMQELAAFYQQGLALAESVTAGDKHIGFALGNLYLGFDQVDEPVSTAGSNITLWFRVDDIDATFQHLVGLGAAVRYAPTEKYFGDKVAAVYDLDGNMIGLSQRK
ncbi:MAG: VOC family protein [Anaerolineales bacterium]|nr:VOC family protein [Anaerolineales bacterium]